MIGVGVYLDPALNVLATPDGDRAAAHRYLDQLSERARSAATDRGVAEVLSEVAATHDGLLPHLVQTLITTWATWSQRGEGPPPRGRPRDAAHGHHQQPLAPR
ncbi:hypothetical protein OG304_06790 [Streptomyces sp. NBC_00160]|uniref:hypothetical protein n=1 Tax=Streptomyces sp. NBC_00160 TaxID=2903628 RepID=UPI0022558E2C|nr:hypothetical protein [Streptomyces sp. NBC_00160]MCX5303159.1 hypothetical protein [Streptomyces sp. NBC_00160]